MVLAQFFSELDGGHLGWHSTGYPSDILTFFKRNERIYLSWEGNITLWARNGGTVVLGNNLNALSNLRRPVMSYNM